MKSDTEAKPAAWRWKYVHETDWQVQAPEPWAGHDRIIEPLFTNPSSIRNAALDEAAELAKSWGKTAMDLANKAEEEDESLGHMMTLDMANDISASILSLKDQS